MTLSDIRDFIAEHPDLGKPLVYHVERLELEAKEAGADPLQYAYDHAFDIYLVILLDRGIGARNLSLDLRATADIRYHPIHGYEWWLSSAKTAKAIRQRWPRVQDFIKQIRLGVRDGSAGPSV